MFSQMIQSLLNSGGKSAAMQRAAQLNSYVNNISKAMNPAQVKSNPLDTLYPANGQNVQSFEKVLSGTKQTNFGSLLLNPEVLKSTTLSPASLNVSGNIYTSDDIDTGSVTNDILKRAIQEVNDARRDYSKPEIRTSNSQILDMVNNVARKHGVDEKLVQAVIKQESGFNTKAKSKAGAVGLMQLMPSTAKSLGVKDPYNPQQNVEGGVKYLKSMLKKYNGNVILALAAYNAGPNAVDKYSGVPPYKETQNYVKNILANYL